MTVSFTDSDYRDFTYELNDGELVNDVIIIVGNPGAEVLTRGYDTGSIAKYGRRSYRVDKAIVANEAPAYATPRAQATAILDRKIESYANLIIEVLNKTDEITAKLLGLEISDLVIISQDTMSISGEYFIVESIELQINLKGYITAIIGLIQARENEKP